MVDLDEKFDTILIIGNGFDLNQNIPTSYSDFINGDQFQALLHNNNYLASYLYSQHDLFNWIDIENELKKYSVKSKGEKEDELFSDEFNMICSALKVYLSQLNYSNLVINSHSFKLINNIKNDSFLILDFNYTDTTCNILRELSISDEKIDKQILKIHGSYKNDIIFGVEDKARISREHVFLRKAYNKNFIATDFKNILEECKNIYIFGHSLGETDHMYFENFFRDYSMEYAAGKGKNIYLYHYGQESYKQLFIQFDKMTLMSLSTFRKVNRLAFIDTMN